MGSGGVIHCRCAKCFCYPSKRRIRRRPRNLTILNLPEDALFHILKWLSVGDILAVRAVHSHLKYLVDNHASVWACASFQELWPSPGNLKLFERAAEKGNFEAAVKLGIAYLYNEGLSVSDEARAEVNGLRASRYFSLAERLNVGAAPFIWLFIRPPWSVSGSCCKAVVHESLRAECQLQKTHRASILHCLGRVLSLFEDEEKQKQARNLFEESANQGCLTSSYLLWESDRRMDMLDPGRCLHSFRKLRDFAAKGCWEAQLSLAKACAHGHQLGLEAKASSEIVCQLFQASHAVNKQRVFSVQKGLNDTMRYILIDWLVEVATMKDFSSLCLHLTVECVDRYLRRRLVPRYRLQLLGIACMVICTRFISKEILTIREAVWLTDNTYKYEDLVRMMGEVVSALDGKIRVPTVVDYKDVLLTLVPMAPRTQHLCSFLCELSLLHTSLAAYAPAHLAAAALLLARLTHGQTQPWTTQLWDLTGFSCEDLIPCVLSLHQKCFHDDAPKDYRQVSLTAVKQRFEDKRYEEISLEEVLSYGQLCAALGVKQESLEPAPFLSAGDIHAFLSSPSGRRTKRKRENSLQEDRGSFVTTPTAELSSQEETLLGSFLDWSLDYCSGYEGDQESEGEKEGDVTAPSGVLDVTVVYLSPEEHCCQESSDEEACPEEACGAQDTQALVPGHQALRTPGPEPPLCSRWGLGKDVTTSGYSSVNSASPTDSGRTSGGPLRSTSELPTGSSLNTQPCHHHARKSCLQCRPPSPPESCAPQQQVKRKNLSAHSEEEEEDMNLGFLKLLVAELRDALDSCAERQRQLEQSLRVSRRLLRVWEPAETPAPEPTPGSEINKEAPSSACPPSPQDLKELELLTQALEKAVRVRKGLSKAGEGVKARSLKSGSASTATKASAPPSTSRCTGSRAPETKPPRGVHHPWVPAKDLPGRRLLLVGDGAHMGQGAGANKPEAGLRDQQIVPQAASQVPEAFTLKDKGALLRLPEAFRKAASRNASLWAQLSSMQTRDSVDAAAATAKTQFLQKMQTAAGLPSSMLSAAEVGRLQKACSMLRLRMREELTADPKDWTQEYRSLLTLEGLQALAGQCLHRLQELQELRSAVVEQPQGPWPEGPPRAALPCGGGADPVWSPQLLLYSSTQELQTLAALRLRVAMLDQQVHLEKVLMAELLPLLSEQEPLGRPWLALCRAAHCLLCEGGQRFLTVLQDEPADRLSPP